MQHFELFLFVQTTRGGLTEDSEKWKNIRFSEKVVMPEFCTGQ
ncbi:MAG: hypothetical protein ACJA0H_002231 [Francisellaceae bacterium]|jgi:hypothetical protein